MKKKLSILIVEHSQGDELKLSEAVKNASTGAEISVVENAGEAIQFLSKEKGYSRAETPDLLFIDLGSAPAMVKLLIQIKKNPKLCMIPLIIFGSSSSDGEILSMYQNRANCYITKPINFKRFIEVIQLITDFWTNIARLAKIS